jgi:hypothetical protein
MNVGTGAADLVFAEAQTGSRQTDNLNIDISKYVKNNKFTVVFRDVYPARLGNLSYTSYIYQATLAETF